MTSYELRVGTCGWSYKDWVGPFYPPGTRSGQMLELYATVFDTVEINSTFYAVPSPDRVEQWNEATPETFSFTAKAPSAFTHEARLRLHSGWDALEAFNRSMEPLGQKLDRVLVQLPPSLTFHEGEDRLWALLEEDPFPVPWVLEARHRSWASPAVFEALEAHGVTWAWSENDAFCSTPRLTTRDAYIRLIGDRSLEVFDRIQRDPTPVIDAWAARMEAKVDDLQRVRVFANNHFAGFGPGTVNAVLDRLGREPQGWSALGLGGQTTLGEYASDSAQS